MRIRNALVAAAAAVVLPLAMFAVGGSAGAATPPCTPNFHNNSNNFLDCLTPFNQEFGLNYIWDVYHGQARVGQPVILFQNSTHDGAQDFSYYDAETVCDYYTAGALVSAAVVLHYGGGKDCLGNSVGFSHPNDWAFEAEFTPYGVPTGLCVGVATTAARGTPVSLQPCGATAKTVWIIDWQESNCLSFGHHHGYHPNTMPFNGRHHGSFLPAGYLPLINGSDTNFSHPFVLSYPSNGAAPWDRPRPQLMTTNLAIFSNGTVFDSQMWGLTYSGPQQAFPPPCSQFYGHFNQGP
ncbi:MAG TPA: hypothetical protein VKD26_04335 [Streptosporangiaceae bacterium]|nr:hypothetical protein [Streptosporangiaceae bacterium]